MTVQWTMMQDDDIPAGHLETASAVVAQLTELGGGTGTSLAFDVADEPLYGVSVAKVGQQFVAMVILDFTDPRPLWART